MARNLQKSWQNKDPFTRRVRWYSDNVPVAVRLAFEDYDAGYTSNRWYGDEERRRKHTMRSARGHRSRRSTVAATSLSRIGR